MPDISSFTLCWTSLHFTIRIKAVLVIVSWSILLLHTLTEKSLYVGVCVCISAGVYLWVCVLGSNFFQQLLGSHYSATVTCCAFYLPVLAAVSRGKGKDEPHLCSECISTHHIFNLDLSTGSQQVYWIVTEMVGREACVWESRRA